MLKVYGFRLVSEDLDLSFALLLNYLFPELGEGSHCIILVEMTGHRSNSVMTAFNHSFYTLDDEAFDVSASKHEVFITHTRPDLIDHSSALLLG